MIYIISGASRSGKSLVAKRMLKEFNIPYLPVDSMVMGFTNGMSEVGIHDKLYPDEIARKIAPFINAMIESLVYVGDDYILEGEAFLPSLMTSILQKYPSQIKVCFIGYTDVSIEEKSLLIKKHANKNDWLSNEPEQVIQEHIKNMVVHSKMIKQECEKYHMAYYDTSKHFEDTINKAIQELINDK